MKAIEPSEPTQHEGLTRDIRSFWTRNVNAERIMGQEVSRHERGAEGYFRDLETQRFRSHRHLLPWIHSMVPGRTVLEIGSGVGLDSFAMAKHGMLVTAVDLTTVGVQTARERFNRSSLNGNFAVADACRLAFRDNVFDYVYSFGVLHHAADTEQTIHEVHRVLRSGGEALIMLYHRHSLNELVHRLLGVPFEERDELCPVVRRYTRGDVRRMFAHFRQLTIAVEYVYGEGYGALFRLTPRWLYDTLSRFVGWHLMIRATK